MREILFRAWDKQRREYLSGGEVFVAIQPGKRPKNILYFDILKDPDMYKDRFELEQFTGLTDMTGKKIYEGDICKDRYGEFEVRWDNNGGARYLGFYLHKESATKADICYVGQCDKNGKSVVEIIGNIHDNPELINFINN